MFFVKNIKSKEVPLLSSLLFRIFVITLYGPHCRIAYVFIPFHLRNLQNACYVDFWPSTLSNGDVPGYQGGSDAAASADGTDGTSDASADSSDGSTDSSDGSGDYSDGSSDGGSYDDGSSDDGSYDDGSSDDSEDYSDDSVDYGDGTE